MKEYRKNDVLEKLKAAFEAGMTMAKMARKEFWDKRKVFFWTLKQYHAERGRDVPELIKVLFDAFVEQLSLVFDEADLRVAFQDVLEQVDQSITDDVQLEFNF